MTESLNIGLVGSGLWDKPAHGRLPASRDVVSQSALPSGLVRHCRSNDSLAGEKLQTETGLWQAYGDWRRLMEDPADVMLVDISTPEPFARRRGLGSARGGQTCLCEKPMAVKVEDAQRMAAAAKKAGVQTLVAFNNVKTPAALRWPTNMIDEGEIGDQCVSEEDSTRLF